MSSFRFLHAADLHLDSPLRGLAQHEGLSLSRIRNASRKALDTLVETALREDVAFVVIAGDLYDGSWKTIGTGLYMARALGRLLSHNIRVFLLQGNHDAVSVLTRDLPLPEGVARFPSQAPETFRIDTLGVALHGQSFASRHVPDDMTRFYPPPVPGYFNIGVLHTSLSGHGRHETYAPCTQEGLAALGYDYWALGHVHERMIAGPSPHIVFPGVLQGRHIHEQGEKGAVLVTVRDGAVCAVDPVLCDDVRWTHETLDCTGIEQDSALHERIGALLRSVAGRDPERLFILRLTLCGETSLHQTLARPPQALREAILHLAAMSAGTVELEKLVIETRPPERTASLSPGGRDDDAIAGFLREAAEDPALRAQIRDDLEACLGTLPLDTPVPGSLLALIRSGDWDTLLPRISETLLARLSDGSEGDAP